MLHPLPHKITASQPIVELCEVACGYSGESVIEGVNIKVLPGDFVGLLGPSGAGKTTVLRALLGGVKIYSGEVKVDGRPFDSSRLRVGYVPQLETIDWNFPVTVEQVVLMGKSSDGWFPWTKAEDRDRAYELMGRLGIAELGKRHIRQLSGGQQQRVFLARALVSEPKLLLLDEPTVGVDIKTRDDVLHLLDELNHQGITIVLTTHELNSVAAHLPWVICINRHIVAEGPPRDVYTPAILKETFGAEMAVVEYEGLTLVAEMPHLMGAGAGDQPIPEGLGSGENGRI